MTLRTPVPSDLDATCVGDLVADCREVMGVLGASAATRALQVGQRVIDLTSPLGPVVQLTRIPLSRLPLDRLPFSFGTMPAEFTEGALVTSVASLDGYGDYGS